MELENVLRYFIFTDSPGAPTTSPVLVGNRYLAMPITAQRVLFLPGNCIGEKMNIKAIIPADVKRSMKIALRTCRDYSSGNYRKFAELSPQSHQANFDFSISLEQPIRPGTYFEN